MATVNIIEQRILEMDGGEFQKLCDAYLSAIGYGKPNSTGGVAGANKVRKGTPDTYFELPNGKFVFAEYTTQKDNLLEKFEEDLGKCLNEEKTGVPVSEIETIIICYTGQLEPAETMSLRSICELSGVKLTLFSISALANDLLNHTLIVRKFLNLALDTGQVIPLESFPEIYGKSKFATTLETKFHFREKEIEEFSSSLDSYDLVVVSGKAGIGKSRFALEGCRKFINKHPEYKGYSIISLSQNLYEDLQERFSSPGQYLILIDDANRVIDFSYFMHILRTRTDNQRIKIVVTVRDYALIKIENDILNYTHKLIQLDRFTNDQIKELAKDEFGILNPNFLERIIGLSAGNPRIAMMISKVAIEKNNLQSINDVSSLYEEYFKSIQEDLQNLGESNLLKTAGIIAFFRVVDRINEQMMIDIQNSFNISIDEFWDCAFELHKLEVVDMYENNVVRISDQVLSTFLFYSVFFKEKILDFSDLLQNYFPSFRSKIYDSLFPVLNAFDQNAIFDIIRPKVQKTWDELMSNNDEENLILLAEGFWKILPTPTLFFIKKRLSQSQFAVVDYSQLEQIDSNKINNISLITELKILGWFRHAPPDLRNIALELIFDYLETRPAEILQILHVLIDDYGFDRFSNQGSISIQQTVIDMLWEHADNGKNELYSRLFIALAEEYLKTHFQTNEMHSDTTVTIYSFSLQPSPAVFQLRTTIFNHLFELYAKYKDYVFTVIQNYVNAYHQNSLDEIFSNDAISLIRFIQNELIPQDYLHSILVNDYLDFLEHHNVVFDNNIRNKFQNDTYQVYRLLTENRKELLRYNFEESGKIKKEKFTSYFSKFTNIDVKHFINICLEIGCGVKQIKKSFEINSNFITGLCILAEMKQDLFKEAISHYLQKGGGLNLNPIPLIKILIMIDGKDKTLTFLSELNCTSKMQWLFGYYQSLQLNDIGYDDLSSLYKLFQEAEYEEMPQHLDFLLNYKSFDNRVIAKVSQLILDKGNFQYSSWILNTITNPNSEIHKYLLELFKDDIGTLKEVYLTVKAGNPNNDHNSATLLKLLELDPDFINEYIEWIYAPKTDGSSWHRDIQDYSALWLHHNFRDIFKKIIDLVYNKEKIARWQNELRHFFMAEPERKVDVDIQQRQEELLTELIDTHSQNIEYIEFLFEVIVYFPNERRARLLFAFLQNNKKIADFRRLAFESEYMFWSGSAVPLYQEKIDYLKSLLIRLNTAQLLEHRDYIQKKINDLEHQKDLEKKKDFMGKDY